MAAILRTIHGSHLYGLAHMESDEDTFTVVEERRRARQNVNKETGIDSVVVGFPLFMARVEAGSHQSVEALFSRVKAVDPEYEAFFANYRVTSPEAFRAYERTITKFAHWGDIKRQRHAIRLAFNLRDLRSKGRFNPTLHPAQVRAVKLFGETQEDTFMAVKEICGMQLEPDEKV